MNNYKNLIFTHHALDRLKQRSISQDVIFKTVNSPKKEIKKGDKVKFIKTVENRNIQVIAQYNEHQHKWLVISVWVRGEEDKPSLMWQIISLPFKLIYFLLAKITRIILSYNKSLRHLKK